MRLISFKDEMDTARWKLIFMLLSSKKIGAFFSDMELPIQQTPALLDIAQAFVEQYHRIESDSSLSGDGRFAQYEELFLKTFERIIHELGQDTAMKILQWGEETFQYDMHKDASTFVWRFLLRRLGEVSGLSYPLLPLALPAQQLEQVKAAIVRHLSNFRELQQRLTAAEQEPLSPWEEQLYSFYTTFASLADWVENTVEFVNVRSAWRQIETILSIDELEILEEWGKKQAEVMEIPSTLVKLPHFPEWEADAD